MNKILTCEQVLALINLYVQGNLSPHLSEYILLHLQNCPSCMKKVEELSKIYSEKYVTSNDVEEDKDILKFQLHNNLSSYVDNELSQSENIRIKKITIANQNAKKLLENLYSYKKLLNASFNKTKHSFHNDYSKKIIARLYETDYYSTDCFYKLSIGFVILIFSILIGFVYLYF